MNKLTHYTTEKIFIRLLTNKSKKNYWSYVRELRKRKTDEIYQNCVFLVKSNSLKERILGVDILAQFGYPRLYKNESLNIFFDLLKVETDTKIISSILYGIGHNNENLTKKQINFLCEFKNHHNVNVRYSLVFALFTIDNEKAIDSLIELSKDKNSRIRDWATFGLGSQIETNNQKIRTALWDRISDQDEAVRLEAISGLAKRKDCKIKKVLIYELENIDQNGSLILESIEELNDSSLILYIEKQIQINKVSKSVNEQWLLDTLNILKKNKE